MSFLFWLSANLLLFNVRTVIPKHYSKKKKHQQDKQQQPHKKGKTLHSSAIKINKRDAKGPRHLTTWDTQKRCAKTVDSTAICTLKVTACHSAARWEFIMGYSVWWNCREKGGSCTLIDAMCVARFEPCASNYSMKSLLSFFFLSTTR